MKKQFKKLIVVLIAGLFLVSNSYESRVVYCDEGSFSSNKGDVNGDGKMDLSDAGLLRDFLVGNPVGIYESEADMNNDETVDMKDLVLLERTIGAVASTIPSDSPSLKEEVKVKEIVYGRSEQGRDLVCTIIEPIEYKRTILSIYAIHGFEDCYDHDGQELVDTANLMIEHFSKGEDLSDTRLMIISCANPDGLIEGSTNNGFGRCNANGIDLNRDFDAAHVVMTSSRNYTLYPFSAAESCALRDLVIDYQPDVVLDNHGWENCTIGDVEIASVFYDEMGLSHKKSYSDNAHGYFSYWTHNQGAKSLLVEFSDPDFSREQYLNAMKRLTAGEYDAGQGKYENDPDFEQFDNVKAYAVSDSHNLETYLDINGGKAGRIYGDSDLCTICNFYKNGWLKVSYPVVGGERIAYCPWSYFIDTAQGVHLECFTLIQNCKVYRKKDLHDEFGTIFSNDTAYCVAETDSAIQVLYPLDQGGWKLGWIDRNMVTVFGNENQPVGEGIVLTETLTNYRNVTTSAFSENADIGLLNITVVPGDEFDIPILAKTADLIALRVWFMYNTEYLELIDVLDGAGLGKMSCNEDRTSGLYCVLWADSLKDEKNPVDGTLGRIRFRVKENLNVPQSGIDSIVSIVVQSEDALTSGLEVVNVQCENSNIKITDKEDEPNSILVLPVGLTVIAEEAFAGCDFETVYMMESKLRRIESRAFAECKNLKNVYIGDSIEYIADDAFLNVDITIHGKKNSMAEKFAEKNGIGFIVM